MFSSTKYGSPRDLYFISTCSSSQPTSNVGQSSMADKGKVPYGGYVSGK